MTTKNILKRYEMNNGYTCFCCRWTKEYTEWITEDEMITFESLVDLAMTDNFFEGHGGEHSIIYEKDGEVLYGFDTIFGKRYLEVCIVFGDQSHCVRVEGSDRAYITREELEVLYQNHLWGLEE